MRVLVTGGAGFIGSWVGRLLLREGHEVTAFDDLSTGSKEQVPSGARLVVGDLRDPDAIEQALRGHEAVIHLAAKAIVPESVRDPRGTFDVNLTGGWNLLEAMRTLGIKQMVYSSTAAVYGNPARVPIEEDDPKFPINPYGASKLAFEELLHAYHVSYGFDVVMFRYFNPFGPGERRAETKAIPNFIKATLAQRPVPLYWKGEQERDFFYVEDIAAAHLLGLGKQGFHYYNLGSGKGTKVIEVVETIFELIGRRSPIEDLGERPGDPHLLIAATVKAERELHWRASTDLQDGLRRTISYFQEIAES